MRTFSFTEKIAIPDEKGPNQVIIAAIRINGFIHKNISDKYHPFWMSSAYAVFSDKKTVLIQHAINAQATFLEITCQYDEKATKIELTFPECSFLLPAFRPGLIFAWQLKELVSQFHKGVHNDFQQYLAILVMAFFLEKNKGYLTLRRDENNLVRLIITSANYPCQTPVFSENQETVGHILLQILYQTAKIDHLFELMQGKLQKQLGETIKLDRLRLEQDAANLYLNHLREISGLSTKIIREATLGVQRAMQIAIESYNQPTYVPQRFFPRKKQAIQEAQHHQTLSKA